MGPVSLFRSRVGVCVLAGLMVAAMATTGDAEAADKVRISMTGSTGDAPVLIALERGYFSDAGIELEMINLSSGAQAIAPLGSKELDVAGGAVSAGLYNAIERGIKITVVADRTHTEAGIPYQTIFISKQLQDSGKVKSLADLKGRTFAVIAKGITVHGLLERGLKAAGLTMDDINIVYLNYPQQATAFETGAIDASLMGEPFATQLVNKGIGSRLLNTEDFFPHYQTTVFLFGETLTVDNRELGVRFTKALLRGARDYNEAVEKGLLKGEKGEAIVSILQKHLDVPADVLRQMYSHSVDGDGKINLESLEFDWEYLKREKLIPGAVTPKSIYDPYFVETAAKQLAEETGK